MFRNTKSLAILSIVLLISACGGSFTSVGGGQSSQSTNNSNTTANPENSTANQNTAVENKTNQTANVNKSADETPKFKKGEPYKSVREKMIKAGWTPFKSKEAQTCDGEDERCKDFPEMEACAGTGLGNCSYLWKKGGKTLAIYTISDSPIYDGQSFIKGKQQSEADKNDTSWQGGAVVHTPPSNVRESPGGKVICVIREKKMIQVQGSTNITDDDGEWIRTNACGKSGVIHSTQINIAN